MAPAPAPVVKLEPSLLSANVSTTPISATPMDRKVLTLVPPKPLVDAWFNTTEGYYSVIDNPANATCEAQVRTALAWDTNPVRFTNDEPTTSPKPPAFQGILTFTITSMAATSTPDAGPFMLVVEGPLDSNYTGVAGGRLVITSVEAEASAEQQGRARHGVALIEIDHGLSNGRSTDVVINVTASEQDFVARHLTLNGAGCKLLHRQARSVPVNLTTTLPSGSAATQEALPQPKFTYESFVNARGAPATAEDLNVLPELPQRNAAVAEAEQPVSIANGGLVGVDGQPLALKGVNWFGFETDTNMVHGLWVGPNAYTEDFLTVMYRIQCLGFNAVRLPMSFQVLYSMPPRSFTGSCTPSPLATVAQSVVAPGDSAAGKTPPGQAVTSNGAADGICNEKLPNDSIYKRFLYVVSTLANNGFYVIVDNHLSYDTTYQNGAQWAALWAQLLKDMIADPAVKNRVMIDIMNEPDARGIKWTGSSPDATTLYLQAMDALYQVNPATLFLIEGSGQAGTNTAMCWGDGFITDKAIISANGIADPNQFFTTLGTKPYLGNVIISPHYYPPSISQNTANFLGQALWTRMFNSFGYLTKAGYGGHVFPIVFGETGSFLTAANDISMLNDMVAYMQNQGAANDGKHANMPSMVWWDWNADSGDTGGTVDTDWYTIIWSKVQFMQKAVGLTPWYKTAGTTPPVPPPPTTSPVPAPTPPPVPTPPPPTTSPVPAPTPPTTSPAPTRRPPGPSPPPGSSACTVTATMGNPWVSGSGYSNTVNLVLTNGASTTLTPPYTLTIHSDAYTGQQSAWNWQSTYQGGGTLGGAVTSSWEVIPANSKGGFTVGAVVTASSTSFLPTSATLAGRACSVTMG
ncbi:hypothetical protein WJX81_001062 [Elliptochloris bilobata]|uniref:CBM2 domain-containing protein n=1 Tax=Elliptochloris bilobata TaxID=381761 RepID=A0AAW1QML6_9CHLO